MNENLHRSNEYSVTQETAKSIANVEFCQQLTLDTAGRSRQKSSFLHKVFSFTLQQEESISWGQHLPSLHIIVLFLL